MTSVVPSPMAAALALLGRLLQRRTGGSRSGRSYAITVLTPVCSGAEAALADHIHGLGVGEHSPFAALPYVHFGRFVVIDQLKADWPGAPPLLRLESAYLLFTSSLTAPHEATVSPASGERYADRLPESFFSELCTRIPSVADDVWGHCLGYPGAKDAPAFVRYLTAGQVETSLFHVGYSDVTVDEVRQRLAARDKLVSFARDQQSQRDDALLQQAYLKESPKWFPSR